MNVRLFRLQMSPTILRWGWVVVGFNVPEYQGSDMYDDESVILANPAPLIKYRKN